MTRTEYRSASLQQARDCNESIARVNAVWSPMIISNLRTSILLACAGIVLALVGNTPISLIPCATAILNLVFAIQSMRRQLEFIREYLDLRHTILTNLEAVMKENQ